MCRMWKRYYRTKSAKAWKGCGKYLCPPAVAGLGLSHLVFITVWRRSVTWEHFAADGVMGSHISFSTHMPDYVHAWRELDALAGRGGRHGWLERRTDPKAFCHPKRQP